MVRARGPARRLEVLDNLFVQAFAAAGGDPQGLRFAMPNRVPFAAAWDRAPRPSPPASSPALAWIGRGRRPAAPDGRAGGPSRQRRRRPLEGGLTLAWKTPAGPRALRLGRCPVELRRRRPAGRALDRAGAGGAAAAGLSLRRGVHRRPGGAAGGGARRRPPRSPRRCARRPAARAVPGAAGAADGRGAGLRILDLPALGATLSGAGPTVLVWCEPGSAASVAASLGDLAGARSQVLEVASAGARLE